MLLSKKELIVLANSYNDNDELHQSRLLESKDPNYDYKVILKRHNFKMKPDVFYIVISTNEDRNPKYRFKFGGSDLKKLFDMSKPIKGGDSDFITIFIKGNNPKLYIPGNEPLLISEILSKECLY